MHQPGVPCHNDELNDVSSSSPSGMQLFYTNFYQAFLPLNKVSQKIYIRLDNSKEPSVVQVRRRSMSGHSRHTDGNHFYQYHAMIYCCTSIQTPEKIARHALSASRNAKPSVASLCDNYDKRLDVYYKAIDSADLLAKAQITQVEPFKSASFVCGSLICSRSGWNRLSDVGAWINIIFSWWL